MDTEATDSDQPRIVLDGAHDLVLELENERRLRLYTRLGSLVRDEIIARQWLQLEQSDRRLDQTLGRFGILSKPAINNSLSAAEAELRAPHRRSGDPDVGIIIYSDGDRFKHEINDRFGQAVGDQAIEELAIAHVDAIRAEPPRGRDFVGRDGGDEFVTFLMMRQEESGLTPEDLAAEVIRRIEENYGLLNELRSEAEPETYTLTCSFGVAVCKSGDSFVVKKHLAWQRMKQSRQERDYQR